MPHNLILIISILLAASIGGYLGTLLTALKYRSNQSTLEERARQLQLNIADLKTQINTLNTNRERVLSEKNLLHTELAKNQNTLETLQQQQTAWDATLEARQRQIHQNFELLANKILEEKSDKFTRKNNENISSILAPLQDKIQGFEKTLETTQKESISMHGALREQLLGLKDLNLQMSQEASNLTRALKGDAKMQGNWGELVLERVLEKSGLEKNREYFVQQAFTRPNGSRLLPDVVIHLPDGKKMIIDSKVSLVDYERYVNADTDARPAHLKAHTKSIKRHITQLSEKNYHDLYRIASPHFVLMFIPIEPAFAVVTNTDNRIYREAFDKHVVIVTPTTLLATLHTIDSIWNNEKQQRNAMEIARQAGALYDKFEGFITDLVSIGKKIDAVKSDHTSAMNKLTEGRGNLVRSVEKLKKMGATAKKSLPETIVTRAEEE